MKRNKSEKLYMVDESLLGGAALSISDLAIVQANEIKWLINSGNENDLEIQAIGY